MTKFVEAAKAFNQAFDAALVERHRREVSRFLGQKILFNPPFMLSRTAVAVLSQSCHPEVQVQIMRKFTCH